MIKSQLNNCLNNNLNHNNTKNRLNQCNEENNLRILKNSNGISNKTPVAARKELQNILLMDDQNHVLIILTKFIKRLGFNVEIAHNGNECLSIMNDYLKSGKRFKAAILDLTIPGGMGGIELFPLLKELDDKILGIAISGYSKDFYNNGLKSIGFSELIEKPFTFAQLKSIFMRLKLI
ncbi:MAG: response regulator [Promethearchaeota archaeon]